METLFDEIDETTYKGVTTPEYHKAVLDYSNAMFDLFDVDRTYNGNRGMNLMWFGSWTQKFIAREVVDYSLEYKTPLNVALVEVLKLNNPNYWKDLDKLKMFLK